MKRRLEPTSFSGPDHNANRGTWRKCACGCRRQVRHANSEYATKECKMKAEHRGRYRTIEADLAGRRFGK